MIKVLVVDDSIVFRNQIKTSLEVVKDLEVVGTAANGKIALDKLQQMSVDLITLDMEMPEMGGIETIKEIKKRGIKVRIIVFSSQTFQGAQKALEAIEEGADDVVAKPSGDHMSFEQAANAIQTALIPKVLQFTNSRILNLESSLVNEKSSNLLESLKNSHVASNKFKSSKIEKRKIGTLDFDAVLIASSTGGPPALEKIFHHFRDLKTPHKPILIVQHMPPIFTTILAKRLKEISNLEVKEAEHGELIKESTVYVAPGDFHMEIKKKEGQNYIDLNKNSQRNSVRPAADFLFETGSSVYKNRCLGIVLTGMGEDGACGADAIRDGGGAIVIQNKESCVVFGMPGAVFEANCFDEIGDLDFIAQKIFSKLK